MTPTDHRILEAAAAAFANLGVRAASLEAVARRAGVSRATVTRRYRSKPNLLSACAQALNATALDDALSAGAAARAEGQARPQVVGAMLRAWFAARAVGAHAPHFEEVFGRAAPEAAEAAWQARRRLVEVLAAELAPEPHDGVPVRPEADAALLLAAAEGLAAARAPGDRPRFHADLARLVGALVA